LSAAAVAALSPPVLSPLDTLQQLQERSDSRSRSEQPAFRFSLQTTPAQINLLDSFKMESLKTSKESNRQYVPPQIVCVSATINSRMRSELHQNFWFYFLDAAV
jgi:hypothetical protein